MTKDNAEAWVTQRLRELLEGRLIQAVSLMEHLIIAHGISSKRAKGVAACVTYLKNKAEHLRYDTYLADGLPIASGVVEGACRHLIEDRLGITGARWRLESAEAVMQLRALEASGDLEGYWKFHAAAEQRSNHLEKYAEERVPDVMPARMPSPTLKLVKA